MPYTSRVQQQPVVNAAPRTHGTSFHKPHTTLGATGHWIKTAGILAPLVIPEFVKDPEQRWRYVRIASVATALLSHGLWAHKISKEREEERERRCQSMA